MNIKDIVIVICIALILFLLYRIYRVVILKEDYDATVGGQDRFTKNLAEKLRYIDPRINEIFPTLSFYDGKNRSYTIDKKDIYLCKVDKHGNLYNQNQLTLVMLHEITHAICKEEIDHTEKFKQVFNELLEKAEKAGLYDPNIEQITDYCQY